MYNTYRYWSTEAPDRLKLKEKLAFAWSLEKSRYGYPKEGAKNDTKLPIY